MENVTRKISVTLPQDAWDKIEMKKGSTSMSGYFREIFLNQGGGKDIYFVDDQHEKNFETARLRWNVRKSNTEYLTACYILSVPMIFEKIEHLLSDFETPVDWIWRYEWKYKLSKIPEYGDDSEVEEQDNDAIQYDLTGSMLQLGRYALNMYNSYEHFNLMQCISSLDYENYQVLRCAMEMRMGRFSFNS
jgi:hypothetical protein